MARRRPHRPSARDPGDDHRAGRKHRPLDGTRRAGLCSSGLSPADRHLTEGVPCRLAWIVNVGVGDGDGSFLGWRHIAIEADFGGEGVIGMLVAWTMSIP